MEVFCFKLCSILLTWWRNIRLFYTTSALAIQKGPDLNLLPSPSPVFVATPLKKVFISESIALLHIPLISKKVLMPKSIAKTKDSGSKKTRTDLNFTKNNLKPQYCVILKLQLEIFLNYCKIRNLLNQNFANFANSKIWHFANIKLEE